MKPITILVKKFEKETLDSSICVHNNAFVGFGKLIKPKLHLGHKNNFVLIIVNTNSKGDGFNIYYSYMTKKESKDLRGVLDLELMKGGKNM